jgi:hypothetical protein
MDTARFFQIAELVQAGIDKLQIRADAVEVDEADIPLYHLMAVEIARQGFGETDRVEAAFKKIKGAASTPILRLIISKLEPQWIHYRTLLQTQQAEFFTNNRHSQDFMQRWFRRMAFCQIFTNRVWLEVQSSVRLEEMKLLEQVTNSLSSLDSKVEARERKAKRLAAQASNVKLSLEEKQLLKVAAQQAYEAAVDRYIRQFDAFRSTADEIKQKWVILKIGHKMTKERARVTTETDPQPSVNPDQLQKQYDLNLGILITNIAEKVRKLTIPSKEGLVKMRNEVESMRAKFKQHQLALEVFQDRHMGRCKLYCEAIRSFPSETYSNWINEHAGSAQSELGNVRAVQLAKPQMEEQIDTERKPFEAIAAYALRIAQISVSVEYFEMRLIHPKETAAIADSMLAISRDYLPRSEFTQLLQLMTIPFGQLESMTRAIPAIASPLRDRCTTAWAGYERLCVEVKAHATHTRTQKQHLIDELEEERKQVEAAPASNLQCGRIQLESFQSVNCKFGLADKVFELRPGWNHVAKVQEFFNQHFNLRPDSVVGNTERLYAEDFIRLQAFLLRSEFFLQLGGVLTDLQVHTKEPQQ